MYLFIFIQNQIFIFLFNLFIMCVLCSYLFCTVCVSLCQMRLVIKSQINSFCIGIQKFDSILAQSQVLDFEAMANKFKFEERLENVDQDTKDIVNGYIRSIYSLLSKDNAFNRHIAPLITYLCGMYYQIINKLYSGDIQ